MTGRVHWSFACFFLLAACSEPLVALVGTEGDARSAPRADGSVGDREHDAEAGTNTERDAEVVDAEVVEEKCLFLPNAVQAGVVGTSQAPDVLCTAYAAILSNSCSSALEDAGVDYARYAYERRDGELMVRAGRRYALSWPPQGGAAPGPIGADGTVTALQEPCDPYEVKAEFSRLGANPGCTEFKADEDARYLMLMTPVLWGFGNLEFELCPGRCSP